MQKKSAIVKRERGGGRDLGGELPSRTVENPCH